MPDLLDHAGVEALLRVVVVDDDALARRQPPEGRLLRRRRRAAARRPGRPGGGRGAPRWGSPATSSGPALEEVEHELKGSVGEVRRLVYALRPPALDDRGLCAAIADQLPPPRSALSVELDVEPEQPWPPLPAAVELAAERITQEALANAARHSGARSCRVRLCLREDAGARVLAVEVTDDGAGLPARVRRGVGLDSMQERAEELGGCCSIGNGAGRWRAGRGGTGRPAMTPDAAADPGSPFTVLVPDDHRLFRDGLRTLLRTVPEAEFVGEAADGAEAVRLAVSLQPDVVVMDLRMPGLDGVQATRHILRDCPSVRVLVVTMLDDDASVLAAMRAGARGYVLKGADHAEIVRAIRAVAGGEGIFSPAIAVRMVDYFANLTLPVPDLLPGLTPREREILGLLSEGCKNAEIAARLDLSAKTVHNNVSNILTKLQVADRTQAAVRVLEAALRAPDA